MSLMGYLDKKRFAVRTLVDETCEKPVVERIADDCLRRLREKVELGGRTGEVYESVDAYDPVLAWHCRLRK